MAIKKFRVKAIREDEYVIEIDEDIYNDQWRKEFAKYMWDLNEGLPDVAKALAWHQLRNGSSYRFLEGFGNILRDGEMPFSWNDFDKQGNLLPADKRDKPAEGLNIIIEQEDDDYTFEIEEVK